MRTGGKRGRLVRRQYVGDGMDLSRGDEKVQIRFERFIHRGRGIRVSARREKKSKVYDILMGCETKIDEGCLFLEKIIRTSARIAYYAPNFEMGRVEHYEGFTKKGELLMEGERLQFYGKTDFSLLVKKILRTSAIIEIEGLKGLDESIIKNMSTGFIDGIEVGVPDNWIVYTNKIVFWYAIPKGYSVRKV